MRLHDRPQNHHRRHRGQDAQITIIHPRTPLLISDLNHQSTITNAMRRWRG
jgi:hypothetical protein